MHAGNYEWKSVFIFRGYILDGWPILRSEEIPVSDQLEMLGKLPEPPSILFIMQVYAYQLLLKKIPSAHSTIL